MDVHCAFLNGIPDKPLYIYCPEGYKTQNYSILKLNKSIYGLKQSPCCWHTALKACLEEIGLIPCYTDPCLFYSKNSDKPMWLYVHVDDLIFGSSWNTEFKEKINKSFNMEDLGTVKYALGIRITQETNYVTLIQDKLIDQILTEFKMSNCRTSSSPLPSNIKDLKNNQEPPCTKPPFSYRRAIGLLQYLVQCTRPDLAFSVSFLSQFLEAPTESHFNALDHVFKYLVGTKEYSLKLGQNGIQHSLSNIIAFCDADWGGSKDWKSCSASIIYYAGFIGWRSHKQKVVALSSAEAEYNSMTECCQDLLWAKQPKTPA
ncbi:hypothetical protein O181_068292 [Austropuccinia psidii MF-1]|uniref:Reverse transcriptase Ty1/copia-type domain-containing protein n=1 Tax=Austropuccinia psidii MF-1 TaxID=1389203 RepID=A0A9Q3EZ12_9BASI|nr:hypothetical protein [Austropuccinia psidii MF-1]